MNNDSKFSSGFLMGLILGGGAVFLLGTKTGKNLLKILSEQGLDGLTSILEEYDLVGLDEEYEEVQDGEDKSSVHKKEEPVVKETPKRRFFKRVRR